LDGGPNRPGGKQKRALNRRRRLRGNNENNTVREISLLLKKKGNTVGEYVLLRKRDRGFRRGRNRKLITRFPKEGALVAGISRKVGRDRIGKGWEEEHATRARRSLSGPLSHVEGVQKGVLASSSLRWRQKANYAQAWTSAARKKGTPLV